MWGVCAGGLRRRGCAAAWVPLGAYGCPWVRWCSSVAAANVRNIGIIAHIDAGKTTTTERLLYFSEAKRKAGEVDKGTTTTDFMDQERERGITIQSALTNLTWRDHRWEIIDTPGHVDFTMEVERTLRVLDGAVAVFDAVKGVEAQSRTVLLQAKKFHVPFVSYVNKMDRKGADFFAAVASIQKLVHIPAVPLQCPVVDDGEFRGYVDLLNGDVFRWERDGRVTKSALADESAALKDAAGAARAKMLDALSGASDTIADLYLEALDAGDEAAWEVPELAEEVLRGTIRKHTLTRAVTPVLLGSSGQSIAVQPLLDAVNDYLPAPVDRPPLVAAAPEGHVVSERYSAKDPLGALVFKIHVQGRDATTASKASLVRIFSGQLKNGARIYNATRQCFQTVRSLSKVNGENFSLKVDALGPGDVGCVWGMDQSYTGDTLCEEKRGAFELEGLRVPEPVVSICIEAHSDKDDKILQKALSVIQMEDPSIEAEVNEYGQTVLSGMGALHLDITKTKLERGWGVGLDSSAVRVKHREFLNTHHSVDIEHTFLADPSNEASQACTIHLRYTPSAVDDHDMIQEANSVAMSLSETHEDEVTKKKKHNKWLPVVRRGIEQSLGGGPLMNQAVMGAKLDVVKFVSMGYANEDTVLNAADYTMKLLMQEHKRRCALIEPVMKVRIELYDAANHLDAVEMDIVANRRGQVVDANMQPECTTVTALIPVACLTTFAADLLSTAGGEASFTQEFHGYRVVRDASVEAQVREEKY